MTRPPFARLLLAAALAGWLAAPARGQPPAGVTFTYELFAQGSSTPAAGSLSYTPGQPLTVQVYLTQTGGPANYLATEGGLFQGGVRLTFGSPTGTPGVLTVPAVSNIVLNTTSATPPGTSAFNDVADSNATRTATADFAQFSPSTDASYGVLPDGNGRILLGQVTFATNPAGGMTTLVVTDIPPATFTDNLTLSATNLDPAISGASFTVTPVPEPAGLLVAGVAAAAGWAWRRQRSRAGTGPGC